MILSFWSLNTGPLLLVIEFIIYHSKTNDHDADHMIGIHDEDHHLGEWDDEGKKAELIQEANAGEVSISYRSGYAIKTGKVIDIWAI